MSSMTLITRLLWLVVAGFILWVLIAVVMGIVEGA